MFSEGQSINNPVFPEEPHSILCHFTSMAKNYYSLTCIPCNKFPQNQKLKATDSHSESGIWCGLFGWVRPGFLMKLQSSYHWSFNQPCRSYNGAEGFTSMLLYAHRPQFLTGYIAHGLISSAHRPLNRAGECLHDMRPSFPGQLIQTRAREKPQNLLQ